MTVWLYNSKFGSLSKVLDSLGTLLLHSGAGYHGPFNSEGDAVAFYNANKAANPGWKDPYTTGGFNFDPVGRTKEQVNNDVNQVVTPVKSALGAINWEAWVLRIGEIVLGVVLIGVALAHLTGMGNIVSKAVGVAKAIPK